MKISPESKVFLLFTTLTSYVSALKEPNRTKAKAWFKKFFTTGNFLFKELKITQESISEDLDFAHDELEEYLMFIIDKSLSIPVDKLNNYINHINNFDNGEKIQE